MDPTVIREGSGPPTPVPGGEGPTPLVRGAMSGVEGRVGRTGGLDRHPVL